MHVALADEAVAIGPAPAKDSYLNIDAIIAAARTAGAEAVHPGYGFLSENADFAQACADAGLIFVGPSAETIRLMGSKSQAKALMEIIRACRSCRAITATIKALRHAGTSGRERIGYPVLIKASAGGGGRGMRLVGSAGELAEAFASAKREAQAAFGDDRMLIEKYIARPRHIEVQVFGDSHGNIVSLYRARMHVAAPASESGGGGALDRGHARAARRDVGSRARRRASCRAIWAPARSSSLPTPPGSISSR